MKMKGVFYAVITLVLGFLSWSFFDDEGSSGFHAVYEVGGPATPSFIEREGEIFLYEHYDSCVIIDPEVEGEKVYIPSRQHLGESGEFFFVETLQQAKIAYMVSAKAKIYREDCSGDRMVMTSERLSNHWILGFGHIIIDQRLAENDPDRLYLDSELVKFDDGLVGRRFLCRKDLILLCYHPS